MPYISPSCRKGIDKLVEDLKEHASSSGLLNYTICRLVMQNRDPRDYEAINDAIGVLECVKLEIYRRVAAPYEDMKKLANGDVF